MFALCHRVMTRCARLAVALPALLLAASLHASPARVPCPLVMIHGLQGEGAVQVARSLGCNTIYFDLPVDAPLMLPSVRAWIAEADRAGMGVLVGLRTCLGGSQPVRASNAEYVDAMREWVGAVVDGLRDQTGIIGWATDHDLERDLSFNDEDFRDYLIRVHGSLAALNSFWGANYLTLIEVDRHDVEQLDEGQPFGVGRASVDLAEYRRSTFRDVMQLWAETIRAHDPDRPLFTGRIARYRGLTAVPDAYDVVMPFVPPDVLERDALTHNVQAVEIGRRGGRFRVLPWIRLPLPPSPLFVSDALTTWIEDAGLRGAVGVCLEDWRRLGESQRAFTQLPEQLGAALAQSPFSLDPPWPTAAVLYEPYAGGAKEIGTPYGYLPAFDDGDVAALAYEYRGGTVFGGLDYLCVEDIPTTDLDRYGAILAPMCLRLPETAADPLRRYVRTGGALYADIGLGMYEAGTWDPAASPLGPQLGIARAMPVEPRYGTFRVGQTHPQLPSVLRGTEATGHFVPGRPTDVSSGMVSGQTFTGAANLLKGSPFQGPSCFVGLLGDTIPLATMSVRYDDDSNPYFLGLIAGSEGMGLTVFACFPAWTWWPVDDPLSAALHHDLLARRARYRLLQPGLLPAQIELSGAADAVALLNRGPAAVTQVLCAAADHRAWLGAIATFSAAEVDASGRRTGRVRIAVELPAASMLRAQAVPVRLRPYAGECCARMISYSPGLIAMHVGGQGAVWGRRRGQPPTFADGRLTQIRFNVDDGIYPVPPGSQHQVEWQEGRGQPRSMLVTADHRGRLDFSLTLAGGQVWVHPPAQPGSAESAANEG